MTPVTYLNEILSCQIARRYGIYGRFFCLERGQAKWLAEWEFVNIVIWQSVIIGDDTKTNNNLSVDQVDRIS